MEQITPAKECEDVILFIDKLTEALAKSKADGKIDWMDIRHAVPVSGPLRAAIEDGDKIPQEIKDASGEVMESLLTRMVASVMALGDVALRK